MARNGRDKKATLAALYKEGLGKAPSQPSSNDNSVLVPDAGQKLTIENRIAAVVAFADSMRDKDTEGMTQEQKSRYVCPLKQVLSTAMHAELCVETWVFMCK